MIHWNEWPTVELKLNSWSEGDGSYEETEIFFVCPVCQALVREGRFHEQWHINRDV